MAKPKNKFSNQELGEFKELILGKLKEAKDLLELDMMSKEEFDALKSELYPIIRGN